MHHRECACVFGSSLLLVACATAATASSRSSTVSLAKLPLRFEPNLGQSDPRILFLARGSGYGVYLTARESVMVLHRGDGSSRPDVVRLTLLGAARTPHAVGLDQLPGKSHYLSGDDPTLWRTNVPQYAQVAMRDVYPGIDLTYHGKEGLIEYDFVVAPRGDPGRIRLCVEGAREVQLDETGNLVLSARNGELVHGAPVVYQEIDGERRSVSGRYVRHGRREVRFEVGPYDRTRPLVIDPVLSYSTYLGGSYGDTPAGLALDSAGNVYITGITDSQNFPTASPMQATSAGGYEAFVAKLNPSGSALVYSTYLGGVGTDRGLAIAVDSAGNAYVTGDTSSPDFPTASPVQAMNAGGYDAFVARLDPSGAELSYSTYLGGSGTDTAEGLAVDASGNAYLTGRTASADFPTASPLQAVYGGGTYDAFVVKLDPSGTQLTFSTYLGGSGEDSGERIAADSSGNAYATGRTASTNFPTVSPLQPAKAGTGDAYVTKLNASGSALVYSTYLGGSLDESGRGIAVDSAGSAYISGYTYSTDFPTVNPLQASLAGADDAFVAKLNPSGSGLVYSTFLGGTGVDVASEMAVDVSGHAHLIGVTYSTDFPTVNSIQASPAGGQEVFVTKLNASGSALAFSTYLGGSGSDSAGGIAADPSGNVYVTGNTESADFPTAASLQPAMSGWSDGYVAKIRTSGMFFYTLTPCRILDTRNPDGTYGGPVLVAGVERVFPLFGRCGIPSGAKAVSVNLTVTQPTANGNLRMYPSGAAFPNTSSINYDVVAGLTRANNAVVAISDAGEVSAYCGPSGTTHFILDVNGYFE